MKNTLYSSQHSRQTSVHNNCVEVAKTEGALESAQVAKVVGACRAIDTVEVQEILEKYISLVFKGL